MLSGYEAQGLTQFDGPRVPQPRPTYATSSTRQSTTDVSPSHQPILSVGRPSASTERIRLRPSSPPLPPHDEPHAPPMHQRTDTNLTVVTQIYSPEDKLPFRKVTEADREYPRNLDDLDRASQSSIRLSQRDVQSRTWVDGRKRITPDPDSARVVAERDDRTHVELEGHDGRGLPSQYSGYRIQKGPSNETRAISPEAPPNAPTAFDKQTAVETTAYVRRPPSPPLTPEDRRSFSLDTFLDYIPSSSNTMAVDTASSRTSHTNIKRNTEETSSISLCTRPSTLSHPNAKLDRLRISPGAASRHSIQSLPISTRSSSLRDTASSGFDSIYSRASSWSTRIATSSEGLVPAESEAFMKPLFFTELEALPKLSAELKKAGLAADIKSNIDHEVLPWEDLECSDALPTEIYRPLSPSVSTRASSFDSAAPPPISLSRFNGPLPNRFRPEPRPAVPRIEPSHNPRSTRKSCFSAFHTPTAPTSTPYQNTIPKQPPIYVSRGSGPSVSSLYPDHNGPKSPATSANPPKASSMNANPHRRSSINAPTAAAPSAQPAKPTFSPTPPTAVAPPTSVFRQNGRAPKSTIKLPSQILSDGPAPLTEVVPPSRRGHSVGPPPITSGGRRPRTATAETAQRRTSWFNTDTLDRTFGGREARRKKRDGNGMGKGKWGDGACGTM